MFKRGRGRPVVYKSKDRRHIVGLIRKHGLTGARKVLTEENRREDGMVPTLPTLAKFAKAIGLTLKRGRPATKKVAAPVAA
jgi:hypothetical protein